MISTMISFSKVILATCVLSALFSVQACAQQETSTTQTEQTAKTTINNSDKSKDQANRFDDMTDEEAEAWLAADDGKVALSFGNDVAIRVEYADTPQERQLGLMYRRTLCDDCGMLFKFDFERIGSIWMKNTYVPLDLAYIAKDGTIVDIFQLQPHDLTPVKSSAHVLYALEMNQGWFAKKDIRKGEQVLQLP